MSGYGMMIPGSKARSNLVSERPTEHGGKEVEHNMIKEAAEFADRAHQGVFRKGTEIPYITHPMETAAIVTAFTDEPEMIAAALLHDVIEDAGVTREELEEKFGPRVAFLVDGESEDKSKSWVERKGATVERLKTSLGSKDHSCCHKDRKNPAFHFSHSLLLLTKYSFTQHHVFFIINVAFKFFQSLCHAFVIPALHLFVFLVETLPHFISQNKIISGCTADIA